MGTFFPLPRHFPTWLPLGFSGTWDYSLPSKYHRAQEYPWEWPFPCPHGIGLFSTVGITLGARGGVLTQYIVSIL